jgi:hypothetical protein
MPEVPSGGPIFLQNLEHVEGNVIVLHDPIVTFQKLLINRPHCAPLLNAEEISICSAASMDLSTEKL